MEMRSPGIAADVDHIEQVSISDRVAAKRRRLDGGESGPPLMIAAEEEALLQEHPIFQWSTAKWRAQTHSGPMKILLLVGFNSTTEWDAIRIRDLLLHEAALAISISREAGPSLGHNHVHWKVDFSNWAGMAEVIALGSRLRSKFEGALIELHLDFFWLQRGYYKSNYGMHWLQAASWLVSSACGLNRVVLPVDVASQGTVQGVASGATLEGDIDVMLQQGVDRSLTVAPLQLEASALYQGAARCSTGDGWQRLHRGDEHTHAARLCSEVPFLGITSNRPLQPRKAPAVRPRQPSLWSATHEKVIRPARLGPHVSRQPTPPDTSNWPPFLTESYERLQKLLQHLVGKAHRRERKLVIAKLRWLNSLPLEMLDWQERLVDKDADFLPLNVQNKLCTPHDPNLLPDNELISFADVSQYGVFPNRMIPGQEFHTEEDFPQDVVTELRENNGDWLCRVRGRALQSQGKGREGKGREGKGSLHH